MPTNDERREVAARLRDVADCEYISDAADFGAAIKRTFREMVPIPRSDRAFLRTIADLIEPEPERTCRYKHIEGTWYMGECGERYDGVIPPKFCPNCGAKVVSDDATA